MTRHDRRRGRPARIALAIIASCLAPWNAAGEGDSPRPAPNRSDEPKIAAFSLDRAAAFLDAVALDWTRRRECFTCHTNLAYLYARPMVSAKSPAHDEVRAALEGLVTERWKTKQPRWDAEVIVSAAALAHNDAATTGQLHAATRAALDRMWTLQRPDGGWDWILCDWPPMENDDHYGVTLAALAVGVAPGGYARSDAANIGVAKMKRFFASHPPANSHHKGMLLWANSKLPGLVTANDRDAWIRDIRGLQLPDGGWSAAALFPWKRGDGKTQTPGVADGYGSGFAIYVLRQAGVPADDPAVVKGVAWLKDNQRASGRWFARSLYRDGSHYLSHAGSAFAVMAIQSCQKP